MLPERVALTVHTGSLGFCLFLNPLLFHWVLIYLCFSNVLVSTPCWFSIAS
jgi:hypothetical protein